MQCRTNYEVRCKLQLHQNEHDLYTNKLQVRTQLSKKKHRQNSNSSVRFHAASSGHRSGISDSTFRESGVHVGKANILLDPAEYEFRWHLEGQNMYLLRVLSDHQHKRKVIHPESSIKEPICVNQKNDVLDGVFNKIWVTFYLKSANEVEVVMVRKTETDPASEIKVPGLLHGRVASSLSGPSGWSLRILPNPFSPTRL